jgi:hypothetical protein
MAALEIVYQDLDRCPIGKLAKALARLKGAVAG